jgi:lysozyme
MSEPVTAPVTYRNHSRSPAAAWIIIAVSIISGFEGFSSHVYRDSVGVPTICYGATAVDHVDLTRTYTQVQCQIILAVDVPKYDAQLQRCLTPEVYDALPPYRHAALVSFTYNVGGGAVCHSSVAKYLNAGNVAAACNALLQYDHAGGRVLQGLLTRRRAERALCLKDN